MNNTIEEHPRMLTPFVLTADTLGLVERFSNLMATAGLTVPEPYRGKPGNCAAVTIQALTWGMNPFAVAAKTHFVNGQIGYEAQVVIAAINTSGLLVDRLNWEWFGPWERIIGNFVERESKTKKDDGGNAQIYRVPAWSLEDEEGIGVRCFATLRGERDPRVLTILMKQARVRNSTLWADDPKQQIAYLSGKRWGRLHTPEVLFGVRTPDELDVIDSEARDMGPVDEVPKPEAGAKSRTDSVKASMRKGREKVPALEEVLQAIREAANSEELAAAGELAAKLRSTEEKEVARVAYLDRLNAGRTAEHEAKKEAEGETVVMTFAQVMDALEKAHTLDVLDVAADLIKTVPEESQRDELEEFYVSRRQRMSGEGNAP
jgi:hypothetical protein